MASGDHTPESDEQASTANGTLEIGVRTLNQYAESGDVDSLFAALSKHLDGKTTPHTYDDLIFSISVLTSSEALAVITWLSEFSPGSIQQEIRNLKLEPKAEALLRKIMSLYGPRVERALFAASRSAPRRDDWKNIDRRILTDNSSGEYVVSLRIRKFNDEALSIEGSARSMVRFARHALRTLVLIDDADALPKDDLDNLEQTWKEFRALLDASRSDASPAAPE
jgi:hypothetical protein